MDDTTRPAATDSDTIYSLKVEGAAQLYARAGHPRTLRTVQRYCASGHLDCKKEATTLGDKYFIDPQSVVHHIAQIEELISLDRRAASRDLSRQIATPVAAPELDGTGERTATAPHDMSPPVVRHEHISQPYQPQLLGDVGRPAPTEHDIVSRPDATPPQKPDAAPDTAPSRVVERLEREVERLHEDRDFLRDQIKTKDTQIAALLERDHETNILVRGLQQMLSPLLGGPRRESEQGSERPATSPPFN